VNKPPGLGADWLESDRLGGFPPGTMGGHRTRRYHALLLTPQRPPADRMALVNGSEAWVETAGSSLQLSTSMEPLLESCARWLAPPSPSG
jgi:hypothetical protein